MSNVARLSLAARDVPEAEQPEADSPADIQDVPVQWHTPDGPQIEELARASSWALPAVDLRSPLPLNMVHAFDTVSSHFFAESATQDRDTLITLLRRIGHLGAPNARVFLSFMRRSVC